MDDLQSRLKEFLNYLDIPMQTFERRCGIGQGLGSRLSSRSYSTTFKRIRDAFPELNVEWLKTGEGEMLRSQTEAALPSCPSGDGMASRLMEEIAAQRRTDTYGGCDGFLA